MGCVYKTNFKLYCVFHCRKHFYRNSHRDIIKFAYIINSVNYIYLYTTYFQAFLGLHSYYRRFIPRFSAIARPLYNLTRKDVPFLWNADCEASFDHLKGRLTQAPVLAYPQFGRDFLLETDASGVGLGAVLSQKQEDGTVRPIAFASRTLQVHEKNYGISEMEALGVVWAVKHFRHYIYGHHCMVFTDHEALKSLLNTPQLSGKLARWGMALQELDLQIEYRLGTANARADALSRYPVSLWWTSPR